MNKAEKRHWLVDAGLLLLMWSSFALLARNAYAVEGFILTEPVQIALIASATSTVASIITLIVTIITNRKVEQVHVATNSMKDALVASAKIEGHAEGVRDEKIKRATRDSVVAVAHADGVRDEKAAQAEKKT